MRIGRQKQFFIDDFIVEELQGLERVLHEASRHPDNPVLWGEHPWELMGTWIYGTVLRDEEAGQYRMWYNTNAGPSEGSLVCYATSEDGIHWHKPELGIVDFRGSKANNIVWATGYWDAYCPSLIYDPRDPGPNRRYKLYTWDAQPKGKHPWPGFPTSPVDRAQACAGMWLAVSPDGIHFSPYGEEPLVTEIGDVLPTVYDEQQERFVSFTKLHDVREGEEPSRRRAVGMSTSPDGLHWSTPRLVLTPDEEDDAQVRAMGGERAEFYGLSGFPYEGIYLGFLWVFHIAGFEIQPGKGRGWDDGPLDIQLAYSRDGETWHRAFSREPIVPTRPVGNFDHSVGAAVNRPFLTDDEIWVYHSGSNVTHGIDFPPGYMAIGLAKFRRDGFVSLGCGPVEGTLLTKPFTLEGEALEFNLDAGRGYAKAELSRPDGTPIDGFRAEDCDVMTEDRVRYTVSWKGRSDLSALQGQEVRLRVMLRHANLYAFRVFE